MQIITLTPENKDLIQQTARILVDAFREHWPDAWSTFEDALQEVDQMLAAGRICRVAVSEDGDLLGAVGGIPQYGGNVWELHPLVIRPNMQRQGIGRALVADFEEQVRLRGGLTIMLGTDDEDWMTSLSGADLYEDLWNKINNVKNLKNHPYGFYQKLGYIITGVVPDANGRGRPDIIMSKRVTG